jgi:hypothetical protein
MKLVLWCAAPLSVIAFLGTRMREPHVCNYLPAFELGA